MPGHCDGIGCLLRYLTGAITAGRLVCYWNLPLFSYSSIDPKLSDKNVYNTLIRMMSPFNHMATCLGKLFQHYQVGIVQITSTPSQVIALITCALGFCILFQYFRRKFVPVDHVTAKTSKRYSKADQSL